MGILSSLRSRYSHHMHRIGMYLQVQTPQETHKLINIKFAVKDAFFYHRSGSLNGILAGFNDFNVKFVVLRCIFLPQKWVPEWHFGRF